MKRLTVYKLICVLAFCIAIFVGCDSTPTPKAPKPVKTVAFITNTTSNFWTIARKGCEKADAELADVKVVFKTTNTGATDEQIGTYETHLTTTKLMPLPSVRSIPLVRKIF